MDLLQNAIQPYAWGSRTALAALQGRAAPAAGPEAELWMGAHPQAPSRVGNEALDARIAAAPGEALGPACLARFGPRLPFLLKVLAAAQPLSLQAHPSEAQARAGFEDEERRGVPRSAPHRNYKDPHHKPELLCALTPFDALCGFRPAPATAALLEELGFLEEAEALLRAPGADGLRALFGRWMSLPRQDGQALAYRAADQARRLEGEFQDVRRWTLRLSELYPGDVGVACALLLNVLHLEPLEAVYLPAGNLHAYLGGVGVEVMASSDNVLRGGLTPKHVDVPELLKVLDFAPLEPQVLRAAGEGPEAVYRAPAPEFRLSRIALSATPYPVRPTGPEVLLCTEGRAHAGGLTLQQGQSAFVPFSDGPYAVQGEGTLFRAAAGEPA